MLIDTYLLGLYRHLNRNNYTMSGRASEKIVNIEWWDAEVNVGDILSPVIVESMLKKRDIDINKKVKAIKHLYALGSIIGYKKFDATIWGSGIIDFKRIVRIHEDSKFVKYDIRALRGPLTKQVMKNAGYNVEKCVLGDPGVLMPKIFNPANITKKYEYSIICHHMENTNPAVGGDHYIEVKTTNYIDFITQILESELVISSSLHGIILAESYGIPAVFYLQGDQVENQLFKYYDWYYSTGRYNVKIARSIKEAKEMEPMPLPDLSTMQTDLERCFPYDLWEE